MFYSRLGVAGAWRVAVTVGAAPQQSAEETYQHYRHRLAITIYLLYYQWLSPATADPEHEINNLFYSTV